jgi:hypothetical protein
MTPALRVILKVAVIWAALDYLILAAWNLMRYLESKGGSTS